nr:MAG: hypothetical protein [Microvirus sp.]
MISSFKRRYKLTDWQKSVLKLALSALMGFLGSFGQLLMH